MARRPVQARARERRESLLDAVARILERDGFGAVNTNAIAAEAGAAVGTVYDYFPNKDAILGALLERYRSRLEVSLFEALGGAGDELGDLVATGVRAFAHFYEREPGYAALWLGSQLSQPLLEAGAKWGRQFATLLGPLLSARAGLDAADSERVALTLIHAVSAVVTLALGLPKRERNKLVEEAVVMAQAYLGARARTRDDGTGP